MSLREGLPRGGKRFGVWYYRCAGICFARLGYAAMDWLTTEVNKRCSTGCAKKRRLLHIDGREHWG